MSRTRGPLAGVVPGKTDRRRAHGVVVRLSPAEHRILGEVLIQKLRMVRTRVSMGIVAGELEAERVLPQDPAPSPKTTRLRWMMAAETNWRITRGDQVHRAGGLENGMRRVALSDLRETLREGENGGADRDRTDDLMTASHALSQLSYGPTLNSMNPQLSASANL